MANQSDIDKCIYQQLLISFKAKGRPSIKGFFNQTIKFLLLISKPCDFMWKYKHLFSSSRGRNNLHRCLQSGFSGHPLSPRNNSDVDALIIGGGAVGVSTAYHLAKYGVGKVVLLERSELTSGSTWHAAGLVTTFNTSINAKKINLYSVKLFKELEKETGQVVSFHTPGSLRILSTPLRMDEAKFQMSRQYWNEAEQFLVGPERVLELCPFLNPEKILGGIHNPGDGYIDPYSLTQAMAIGARKYGAEIYPRTEVTGVKLRNDGKWDIITKHGTLKTKHLINASGYLAAEVSRMCGIKHYVPVVPVQHQYFITKEVPEINNLKNEFPVLRDLEGSYYLRQEGKGFLIGPYEDPSRMETCDQWVHNKVPEFENQLFQGDLDRIEPNIEMAMEMVPSLATTEISKVINGPITYNCQSVPLVGPIQGLPNFWQMICFGYGIAQSGGCGHYIAHFIRNGEPPHELNDLDAERYGRWCTKEFALKKARESYGLNNSPTYPKEERWAGRPSARCGPLYDLQKNLGAQMGFVYGWEKPQWFAKNEHESGYKPSFRRSNWFSAMERECKGVIENVGLIDLTSFAKFTISGKQSAEFLDLVTANNIPKLQNTCITHLLTPRGRVYGELTLTQVGENKFLIITGSGSEFHDLWWLESQARNLGFDSIVFENVTDKTGAIGVAGPRSRDFLQPLTDSDLSSEHYKFLEFRKTKIGGIPVDIIRISYTGELGWEIYCAMNRLPELFTKLQDQGKKFDLINFGGYAMNSLRIEKGFRMWGNDMTVDTNPIEAGLGFFVKHKKKSNFIGKSAICKILDESIKKKLVFLQIDAKDVDADGDESIFIKDKVVGNVTSGSYGFQVNKSLAMAYLPISLAVDGQEVDVDLLGERRKALVSVNPLVKIHSVIEKQGAAKHI